MKKTYWIGLTVVVIALIIAGAVKNQNNSTETETIKIGGAFILSGPAAALGPLQMNGSNMAIDEVNAQGGINGRRVELVVEDTAYDPKTSLSAYQALKLKGVRYIIADGSPVVSAIRELVVKDGNIIFSSGATTPNYFDGSNLSCRIALTAKNFGPGFTQLLQKKGYKSVVVLLPDNEYGHGLADEFSNSFTSSGGKILISEFYSMAPGAGDYRTNITKLKAQQSTVDAMVVVQVTNTVEPMFKQIAELGWKKPIVTDYYTLIQNPSMKNLSLVEGVSFVDYQYSRDESPSDSPAVKKFKEDYTAKYGASPMLGIAATYEVVKIVLEGIKHAGDSDPQKVADYISHLKNYDGVTGSLTFNDDCEVSRDMAFRVVEGGKIVDLK